MHDQYEVLLITDRPLDPELEAAARRRGLRLHVWSECDAAVALEVYAQVFEAVCYGGGTEPDQLWTQIRELAPNALPVNLEQLRTPPGELFPAESWDAILSILVEAIRHSRAARLASGGLNTSADSDGVVATSVLRLRRCDRRSLSDRVAARQILSSLLLHRTAQATLRYVRLPSANLSCYLLLTVRAPTAREAEDQVDGLARSIIRLLGLRQGGERTRIDVRRSRHDLPAAAPFEPRSAVCLQPRFVPDQMPNEPMDALLFLLNTQGRERLVDIVVRPAAVSHDYLEQQASLLGRSEFSNWEARRRLGKLATQREYLLELETYIATSSQTVDLELISLPADALVGGIENTDVVPATAICSGGVVRCSVAAPEGVCSFFSLAEAARVCRFVGC